MSKIRVFVVLLIMFGRASSYYNVSSNGYTFILPDPVILNDSNSTSIPLRKSFSDAQQWCKNNVAGSTLTTIRSKVVQENFIKFIKRAAKDNKPLGLNIRLNGQYHITDEWRWVNGHPNRGITVHDEKDQLYAFYARLISMKFIVYSENPNKTGRFICEYPDTDNSRTCDLSLNGRCYKTNITSLTWFGARSSCSDRGGDLASFETLSNNNIGGVLMSMFSDSLAVKYWIGIQKNEWRWIDTDSSMKYTNWEVNRPSDFSLQCLCLTRSLFDWKECDCNKQHPFICFRNDTAVSPVNLLSSETVQFIVIIVPCAAIFVVIVVIAAAFIAKKGRNSNAPRAVKSSSSYENSEYATKGTSKDFPVDDEIKVQETNTTYASVQMAEKAYEAIPVNSIVYAKLDLMPRT